MYVYLSENEFFDDFDNKDALFWSEEEMTYGDWTGGENGDGTYEISTQIKPSEVPNYM